MNGRVVQNEAGRNAVNVLVLVSVAIKRVIIIVRNNTETACCVDDRVGQIQIGRIVGNVDRGRSGICGRNVNDRIGNLKLATLGLAVHADGGHLGSKAGFDDSADDRNGRLAAGDSVDRSVAAGQDGSAGFVVVFILVASTLDTEIQRRCTRQRQTNATGFKGRILEGDVNGTRSLFGPNARLVRCLDINGRVLSREGEILRID